MRRCLICGNRQMANTSNWREAKGDYKRDEHYAELTDIRKAGR